MSTNSFARALWQRFDALVDMRLVAIGLGVIALSSCSADQAGNVASPVLGVYIQIDHVGRPGAKEIFENYADHETSNRNTPISDPALSNDIQSFVLATNVPSTANARNGSAAQASGLTGVFYPDELEADIDGTATAPLYLGLEKGGSGVYGGRAPSDPAMETDLSEIYGASFGGGAGSACLQTDNLTATGATTNTTFPYVH